MVLCNAIENSHAKKKKIYPCKSDLCKLFLHIRPETCEAHRSQQAWKGIIVLMLNGNHQNSAQSAWNCKISQALNFYLVEKKRSRCGKMFLVFLFENEPPMIYKAWTLLVSITFRPKKIVYFAWEYTVGWAKFAYFFIKFQISLSWVKSVDASYKRKVAKFQWTLFRQLAPWLNFFLNNFFPTYHKVTQKPLKIKENRLWNKLG